LETLTAFIQKGFPITMKEYGLLHFSQDPITYNGSTYVPLREMMQYMGKRVDWSGDSIELKSMTQNRAITPNGKYVLEGQIEPTQYFNHHMKNMAFTVGHQVDTPDHISYPNHSSVISHEEVNIEGGTATLLKLSHDNFTPQESVKAMPEIMYWLYVSKPVANDPSRVDTYFLSGEISEDLPAARNVFLMTAKTWDVMSTVPQHILYENAKYHFSIELPQSWEGKYEVEDTMNASGNNVSFINKATKYGVLFTISIWSKDDWAAHGKDFQGTIPVTKIGETYDKVYLFQQQL
jgi:hypothetical protein